MGLDSLPIPYPRLRHERGLGVADPPETEVVGADISAVNCRFGVKRSVGVWGDQPLRRGPLRLLERIPLHSLPVVWAPLTSNIHHDWSWRSLIGGRIIRAFRRTEWDRLLDRRHHFDRLVDDPVVGAAEAAPR